MLTSPVDISIVLASCCPLPTKLNSSEDTLLAFHLADEFDGSMHSPRYIDLVADGQTIGSEAFVTGNDGCHFALICQWT